MSGAYATHRWCLGFVIVCGWLLLMRAQPALGDIISPDASIAPPGGVYNATSPIVYTNGVVTDTLQSVGLSPTSVSSIFSGDETVKFIATMTGDFTLTGPSLALGGPFTLTDPNFQVTVLGRTSAGDTAGPGGLGFDLRLDHFDFMGTGAFSSDEIKLDPTQISSGHVTFTDVGGGNFQIHSFFDVFTEVSLNGGALFVPQSDGPTHFELDATPEPASLTLLTSGSLVGLAFFRRKCHRRTAA